MKKTEIIVLTCVVVLLASGCGGKEEVEESPVAETMEESATSVADIQETQKNPLQVPTVTDGIQTPGDDAIIVRFEWEAVDGADGYEVSKESKYYKDDAFGKPEFFETQDTFHETYAQDEFDFRIKVRAFRGEGNNKEYSDWSGYATGSARDENTIANNQEDVTDEESSPFLLWEYEGYVDECRGYTWQNEFKNCDYDGDGKTDRVRRSRDAQEDIAVYTIEFGNGDKLVVPDGWDTGFPHVQGGDLDGDGAREILVTLSYDTGTDPYSYGDMWLFDMDEASGNYSEITLPLVKGENGAKGFEIKYEKPQNGKIRFTIPDTGFSQEAEVGEEYISYWGSEDAVTEMRSVYKAWIDEGDQPAVKCYIQPFRYYSLRLGFDLYYRDGKYEIGSMEMDTIDEDEGLEDESTSDNT